MRAGPLQALKEAHGNRSRVLNPPHSWPPSCTSPFLRQHSSACIGYWHISAPRPRTHMNAAVHVPLGPQGTQEWAQLLPYHRGQLLVLLLLHDGPPPGPELLAALAAVLGRGAGPAAAALAAEVPGRSSTLWHERGHRYCYTDALCRASRWAAGWVDSWADGVGLTCACQVPFQRADVPIGPVGSAL